ncbi:thiomuracin/GE37468 family thiazolyl RiPP peptide [Dactylosporangium sp. NPDC051541]|uniref:thiomuracin/GE37468 family thiazolyl RiPP peptide n=1 Tax=Dactylosporangium sp. NPDC051541 TaxID=3363977 RepID=UPI0037ACA490
MTISQELDFELESLPVDVFDLADSGLVVESLTSGHGMAELGASSTCCSVTDLCSCKPL